MVNHLSSRDFLRLRIGIGHPGHKDAVTRYVLSRSPKAQREEIDGALDRAERVLPLVLEGRLLMELRDEHRKLRMALAVALAVSGSMTMNSSSMPRVNFGSAISV